MTPLKIQVYGKSGRLDAILEAYFRSRRNVEIETVSEVTNPSYRVKGKVIVGRSDDLAVIEECAKQFRPDFAMIGPEEPLAAGAVDKLAELGIPAVGPTQKLAQLESSKTFTRMLLAEYGIRGNPIFRVFYSLNGIEGYLRQQESFVVKPDGLTGGKGVKLSGEHLHSVDAAVDYCRQLFASGQQAILIEEKLEGEEFSLQSFYDGQHIAHTMPVQDHKRAKEGDTGLNTGGVGSYSCPDHLLPFLTKDDVREAEDINRRACEAVSEKIGQPYKGIIYGNFMLTRNGLRLIEYNARFGDPEALNVLPLMETDFVDVSEAIIKGELDKLDVRFRNLATVCKYVVPEGYPDRPVKDAVIDMDAVNRLPDVGGRLRLYYGAVDDQDGRLVMTGSRAVGIVGIAETLFEAERIAENAASLVGGPVYHRRDIGTPQLVQKRKDHMDRIFGRRSKYAG
jgi:phosphoribosylamine--glycine ligase